MSGGIPLRSITAVAAISLLALASFGTVLVLEIPVTADEALHHAEDVSDPGEVYLWKCPTSDGHLAEIFSAVGQRYGYEDVKAEFAPLRDFKVRWQRSYNWAIFTISDYLDRAPDAVLEDLAAVLFAKITGENREYGDVFINYITDKNLTRTNCKDFLKRSRNLSKESIGEYHDLNDCVNRLRDMRLIPDDIECILTAAAHSMKFSSGVFSSQ